MTKHRAASGSRLVASKEWVGGCFVLPSLPRGRGKNREAPVAVAMWCRELDGAVLAHVLGPQSEAASLLAEAYELATTTPHFGKPHEPQRVRVATHELAAALKDVIAHGVEVVVAETPEVDIVAALMAEKFQEFAAADAPSPEPGDPSSQSYFGLGEASPQEIQDIFRAARVLSALAPWRSEVPECLSRLDIPELDVEGAAVTILGHEANTLQGFVILPDSDAVEKYLANRSAPARKVRPGRRRKGEEVMAMQLMPLEDLPDQATKEVREHRWKPVNGHYPWLDVRDLDGQPLPVTAKHRQLAVVVAQTIGSYFAKAAQAFRAGEDAVSMTFQGDDKDVRYTTPYEAYDDFGPELDEDSKAAKILARFDLPPAPRRPLAQDVSLRGTPAVRSPSRPGRNEPCPCGSGLKYKRCHLQDDERKLPDRDVAPGPSGRKVLATPAPSALESGLEILEFTFHLARHRFGAAIDRAQRDFRDLVSGEQLLMEWSLFHHRINGVTCAEFFLADPAPGMPPRMREFLAVQQQGWLSMWEVGSIDRGRHFSALDLLSGVERRVEDRKASETLATRAIVLGRIVEWEGRSQFWGVYPTPLPPRFGLPIVDAVRKRLKIGRAGLAPVDLLRSERIGRFMIAQWEDAIDQLEAEQRNPPHMTTTDGEQVILCTVTYAFDPERRNDIAQALERMGAMAALDSPDGRSEWRYSLLTAVPVAEDEEGSKRLLLGELSLRRDELELITNSRERCAIIERQLAAAVGARIHHKARTEIDPRQDYLKKLAAEADGGTHPAAHLEAVPPPEIIREMQGYKRKHYKRWLDDRIPALNNRTPRQAARSMRGREQLDRLLRDMEHMEARGPEWDRFDFGVIRRELGL